MNQSAGHFLQVMSFCAHVPHTADPSTSCSFCHYARLYHTQPIPPLPAASVSMPACFTPSASPSQHCHIAIIAAYCLSVRKIWSIVLDLALLPEHPVLLHSAVHCLGVHEVAVDKGPCDCVVLHLSMGHRVIVLFYICRWGTV